MTGQALQFGIPIPQVFLDGRADMQPPLEFRQRLDRPDRENLDIAVGEIDCVPRNAQALGFTASTVTKPDALDAAMYGEQARLDGHENSVFGRG